MNSPGNAVFKKYKRNKIEFQKTIITHEIWQCCLNCQDWTGEKCGKFDAVPPVEVTTVGCEDHTPQIPF